MPVIYWECRRLLTLIYGTNGMRVLMEFILQKNYLRTKYGITWEDLCNRHKVQWKQSNLSEAY